MHQTTFKLCVCVCRPENSCLIGCRTFLYRVLPPMFSHSLGRLTFLECAITEYAKWSVWTELTIKWNYCVPFSEMKCARSMMEIRLTIQMKGGKSVKENTENQRLVETIESESEYSNGSQNEWRVVGWQVEKWQVVCWHCIVSHRSSHCYGYLVLNCVISYALSDIKTGW